MDLTPPPIFRSAPEVVRVARGAISIAGPNGYCIDRQASQLRGQPAFVLLASCASLTGRADAGAPAAPGLLTASVERAGGAVPPMDVLRDFLQTQEGRATLARDGQASSVRVLEATMRDGALVLKIRDRSANATPGLEDAYWRGLFALNERLITVTVNTFATRPLGTDGGRTKLLEFIAAIRERTSPESPDEATVQRSGFFARRNG